MNCYLCGKERTNHDVGCLEPLIQEESITSTLCIVASYLGIQVLVNKDKDEYHARMAIGQNENGVVFIAHKDTKISNVIMGVIKGFKDSTSKSLDEIVDEAISFDESLNLRVGSKDKDNE